MKKIKVMTIAMAMILVLGLVGSSMAAETATQVVQINIKDFKAIQIYNGGMITFEVTQGSEPAGDAFKITESGPFETSKLQYAALATGALKITAEVDSSGQQIPAGLTLSIAATAAPSSIGNVGVVSPSPINFDDTVVSADLITGIGSCYTGTDASSGALLDYSLSINSGEEDSLAGGVSRTVNIIYTITN